MQVSCKVSQEIPGLLRCVVKGTVVEVRDCAIRSRRSRNIEGGAGVLAWRAGTFSLTSLLAASGHLRLPLLFDPGERMSLGVA